MKKNYLFILIILLLTVACGSSTSETTKKPDTNIPKPDHKCFVSTSNKKLEIVTWNIEHFPKTNETIKQVASIILGMDVDVIALQEIKSKKALEELTKMLPGWKSTIMVRSGINLGFLYKESEISLKDNAYGILKQYTHELPRSPYILPIHSKTTGLDVIIINNHFKAKGGAKNKARRKAASRLLKEYIDEYHPNDNVVLLGDLNDEITDEGNDNVFQIFIKDASNYKFADATIALENNKKYWSYPSYPSHIDHILVTNELFSNIDTTYTYVLKSCYYNYSNTVSDHYPVCIVLK